MKNLHPSRHNRTPSKNRYPYKKATPPILGSRAVGASIIVSKPNHIVGLQQNEDETQYDNPQSLPTLQPERHAVDLMAAATQNDDENTSLTPRQMGNSLLRSIDEKTDSETTIALKQLAAKICGVEKQDADYQHIIATLDDTMTADDLRDFITYLHEWSHDDTDEDRDTEHYVNKHMNELSGFRVEASFARLARGAGFQVQPAANRYEDLHGLDFRVEGVPFDLKSSYRMAKSHTAKHKKDTNRIHAVKFVPPITADDFEGRLVVPNDRIEYILETTDFTAMVHDALAQYRDAA